MRAEALSLCLVCLLVNLAPAITIIMFIAMYYPSLFSETTNSAVFESANSTYQIVQKKLLWFDNQAHCHAIGGHLVAFETQEEFTAIWAHIPAGGYHLGLNDLKEEGKYVWEHSGQEVGTYRPWARYEPSNWDNQDCGAFGNTGWSDVPCSPPFLYQVICEFAKQ